MRHLNLIFGTLALLLVTMTGGLKHAQAQFPKDYGNAQDGNITIGKEDTLYTDSVRAKVIDELYLLGVSPPRQTFKVFIDTAHYHGEFEEGDKVVIIQMKNGANHGMGYYAVDWIKSVGGNVIELSGGKKYLGDQFQEDQFDYNASVQMIKVPEYENLTIKDDGVVTCHPWDGHTGGVSMFFVWNQLSIQSGGKVTAKGKGFFKEGKGATGGSGGNEAEIQPGSAPNGDAGNGEGPTPYLGECVEGDQGYSGQQGGNGSAPGEEGEPPLETPSEGVETNRPKEQNHKTLQTRMVMGSNGDGGKGGRGGQGGGSGGAGGALTSQGQSGATGGQYGGKGGKGGNGGDGGRGGGIVYIKAYEWQTPVGEKCIDVSGAKGEDGTSGGRGGDGGKGGKGADGEFNNCEYIGSGGPGASGARGSGARGGSGGDGGDAGMFWWTYSKSNDLQVGNVAIEGGKKGRKALGGNPGEKNTGNNGQSSLDQCDNCDDDTGCDDCHDEPNTVPCADNTFSCACDLAFEMLSYTTGYETVNSGNVIGETDEVQHPDFSEYKVQCKYKKDDTSRWLECEVMASPLTDCANNLTYDRDLYVCSLGAKAPCDTLFNDFDGKDLKNIADRNLIKNVVYGQESVYHFPLATLESMNTDQECSTTCGNTFCAPSSSIGSFTGQRNCPTAGRPGIDGEAGAGYGPSGDNNEYIPTAEDENGEEKNKQERGDPSDARQKRASSLADPMTSPQFQVFPNPTKGSLTLQIKREKGIQNYQVRIKSTKGKLLQQQSFDLSKSQSRHNLDLNQLSSGTYFLELQAGNKQPTRKPFVVK